MKNNIPKKYTMAVDIGTAKVAIMVGSPTPKGIDVAAHNIVKSHGVRNGVIQNVDDAVRSIRACLEVVKKQLAAKGITLADIRQVNAGIAGSHIQTETRPHTRVRPSRSRIDNKEIQEMTLQMSKIALKAGRHILHIIPQNYTVDDRNVACADIVGSTGSFIEGKYMIISADKEAVNQVQECIEQCGLKVSKFVFEPLASAEAVLTSEEKQLGVALVDIGGGTTDMIIYANNEIVSVHPLAHGGAMITDDIAQVCCLTSEQAEVLKVKHGAYLCTKENEDKRWRYEWAATKSRVKSQ